MPAWSGHVLDWFGWSWEGQVLKFIMIKHESRYKSDDYHIMSDFLPLLPAPLCHLLAVVVLGVAESLFYLHLMLMPLCVVLLAVLRSRLRCVGIVNSVDVLLVLAQASAQAGLPLAGSAGVGFGKVITDRRFFNERDDEAASQTYSYIRCNFVCCCCF